MHDDETEWGRFRFLCKECKETQVVNAPDKAEAVLTLLRTPWSEPKGGVYLCPGCAEQWDEYNKFTA